MKIGISAIGYECVEHFDNVLAPWNDKRINAEIIISASHGIFPETHKLGFPIYSTDGTIEKAKAAVKEGRMHSYIVADKPMFERDLRNLTLPPLFKQDIDILWLLDLQDEIYSVEEINRIIDFIEKDDQHNWFKINFKNYVFDTSTYVNDFIAPRIWMNLKELPILGFYYDNDILYANNTPANKLSNTVIPRDIAFPKHLSWVGSGSYLKRKINFQKIHYGQCSYKWDEATDKLSLDKEYYLKNNLPEPTFHKD